MTDAHCHVTSGDDSVSELIIGRDFFGVHPWDTEAGVDIEELRGRLEANPLAGVGEIGLDRLKEREIPTKMREAFEAQLKLAYELSRPVVLHGAKCWGQVVNTIAKLDKKVMCPLIFHGFSRSDGLIPDIVKLNGYISVGPAILNEHAVNYRQMIKKIPLERLLIETDRTEENALECPTIGEVAAKTAEILGKSVEEIEILVDRNARNLIQYNQ